MESYIASLLLVGFNYAPPGWAVCNGQLLLIQQNTALFALLGTQFGGNGTTDFALPNMPATKDANGNPLTWLICVNGIFPPRD